MDIRVLILKQPTVMVGCFLLTYYFWGCEGTDDYI